MITKNPMQLKAYIKKKAAEKHISAQLVMQNYMLERLLERISLSPYKHMIHWNIMELITVNLFGKIFTMILSRLKMIKSKFPFFTRMLAKSSMIFPKEHGFQTLLCFNMFFLIWKNILAVII